MRTNNGQILYIPRIGQRANLQHPLMKGCVGWWPLTDGGGGIAKDLVRGNDGTLNGNAAFVSSEIGASLSCSGVSQGGVTASTNPVASLPITVSAWFKTSNTSSDMYIIDGDDSSDRIAIYRNAGGSLVAFAGGSRTFSTSSSVIADGNWHHVVAIYTSSGITGYFDGEQAASGSAATTSLSGLRIGGRYSSTSNWDGELQNIRTYDRALSDSEILQLYTNPWSGLSIPSSTRYFFVPQLITASPKLFSISGSSVSMRSNVGRVSVRAAR